MTTLEIQQRLAALGHDPGPRDGVRGRLTIHAVKACQKSRGLVVDGIVGAKTAAALLGAAPLPALRQAGGPTSPVPSRPGYAGRLRTRGEGDFEQIAPWYAEALRLKGTAELAGGADNPRILAWARRMRLGYAHDSIAWCGLFAAHCVSVSLPDEPLRSQPLAARSWLRFGRDVPPGLGAVLVFWRGSKAGWSGHVGFYAGEDSAAYHVLGGNQSDAVTIARVARTRFLGARWPLTAPLAAGGATPAPRRRRTFHQRSIGDFHERLAYASDQPRDRDLWGA